MQMFILSLLVAVAAAAPLESTGPVDFIVNGLPEGQALDVADIVDIKLQNHVDGEVVATSDLLYPYTAEAINAAAEAAVAEEEAEVSPVVVVEEAAQAPIVVESPVEAPVVVDVAPVPVIVVEEAEVPESVSVVEIATSPVAVVEDSEVAPNPVAVVDDSEVAPGPVSVVEGAEVAPGPVSVVEAPAAESVPEVPSGTVYDDGTVEVQVNLSQEAGLLSSVQSWFSMVLNYFSNGVQTTSHQIV